MAMSKTVLGLALWNAVKATQSYDPPLSGPQDAEGLALWETVAEQIIIHIKAEAVVTINSATANGITVGPGTAPVTGTGVISA